MAQRNVTLLLTALFLASCGGGESDASSEQDAAPAVPTADEEALAELPDYFETHMNMGHPGMVAGIYADSAFLLQADGAVTQGKAAVEAWLTTITEASGQVDVEPMHQMIFGDMAVSMGTYTGTMTPEGMDPVTNSGTYLSIQTKETGEWKIAGTISNYDSERPEGWTWAEPTEAPPEEGTMTDLIGGFTQHWNLHHPDMVADYYTDDVVLSLSNGPMLHGKEAVTAALIERSPEPTTLTVHDVDTWPLDETHAIDGGWWEIHTEAGDLAQSGMYLHLVEKQADGTWKIKWGVTNAQPPREM